MIFLRKKHENRAGAYAEAVLDRLVFPRAAVQIAVQRPFLMPKPCKQDAAGYIIQIDPV